MDPISKKKSTGEKIVEVLKSRNIIIKHLLQKVQESHPEMRGLTENGFRASINKGTIKLAVLEKISEQVGIPMKIWFEDYGPELSNRVANFESGPEKHLLERNAELNKEIDSLNEKIVLLEALLGDKLPYEPKPFVRKCTNISQTIVNKNVTINTQVT